MHDVISATAHRSLEPGVDDVEGEWGLDGNCRVQRGWRLPGAIANPGDVLAVAPGGLERHRAAITGNSVAVRRQPADLHFESFHGRIDEPRRAAGDVLLTE